MDSEKRQNLKQGLMLALLVLLLPPLIYFAVSNFGGYDTEDVRVKVEEHLYEKYGEEFVVDRIGRRSARGNEFYQVRIYPESIIGTQRQGDNYYYGEASLDKRGSRLGGVADTYGELNRSLEIEALLLPETKETFGERVSLKVDQRYEKKNERGNFISYLNPTYNEVKEMMGAEPGKHRIMLNLQVYIFDRIESEEEKERRREEIFEFVQYLKSEGLYEYLELAVIFIDERVLASSYDQFRREVRFSDKQRKEIEGNRVDLPPMEIRERMSKELQKEIDGMSEEELLASMRRIRKDDLSYEGIEKNNAIYFTKVYSIAMLEERYRTSLERSPDLARDYNNLEDVRIRSNLEYVYIN